MRVLTALAALAVLVMSCSTPEPSRPSGSPAPSSARPAPAVVLSKLAIAAKFGEQGIRVSPNGEMVLVVERDGFVHTIYDLAGRSLATVRLGEIGMNPFWLPDSSGVVMGRRNMAGATVDFVPLHIMILEVERRRPRARGRDNADATAGPHLGCGRPRRVLGRRRCDRRRRCRRDRLSRPARTAERPQGARHRAGRAHGGRARDRAA